jgi:predicted kinase
MPATGTAETKLIVLRGNSGSGKSAIASAVRQAYGMRGFAIVRQDMLRREILKEKDVPGGVNIGLIDLTARYALDHGYHVIIEGILVAERNGNMLQRLAADHRGQTAFYYLDVPFAETLRRHATKPNANEFGEAEMRRWYVPLDRLPFVEETVIPETSSLEESVALIMHALDPAPSD